MKPEFYSVPKRRLRPFYVIGILFVVTIALPLLIFFNLKKYAVYYAEHTPHADDIDPAAVELVENMYFNYNPRDDLYFKWKDETIYTVDRYGKYTHPIIGQWSADYGDKYRFCYQSSKNITYILDSDLDVLRAIDHHSSLKEVKIDIDIKERIKEEAYDFINPLIDAQPKPFLLNLQWLYDLLNHDRFS